MRPRTLLVSLSVFVTSLTGVVAAAPPPTSPPLVVETVRVDRIGIERSAVTRPLLQLPMRTDLLGVQWNGTATHMELRVRAQGRRWGSWIELHGSGHGPDADRAEAWRGELQRAQWSSDPIWVGGIDELQLRAHDGVARAVRVTTINATGTAAPRPSSPARFATAMHAALARLGDSADTASAAPHVRGLRSRAAWQASEPRYMPAYANELRGVVIHHTVSTNGYSCAQVPAMLRAIQRYHMLSNGWNDIGYNFLVDRCGHVWEGRAGGISEPVIGAHAAGFNTGTSGIALLGTHSSLRPSPRARAALRTLVAWRTDVAGIKPTGTMLLTAGSGGKFRVGSAVRVRAVSGHRDLVATSCPGALPYRDLAVLARQAWKHGGAKVANLTVAGHRRFTDSPVDASADRLSIRAVSSHADQTVTFRIERISTGELVGELRSTGRIVHRGVWRAPAHLSIPMWDLRVVARGVRASGQQTRSISRRVEHVNDDPMLAVTSAPAGIITPNGDGIDDEIAFEYTLGLNYRLQVTLHDLGTGELMHELLEPTYVGPTSDQPRQLTLEIPGEVAAGGYELRVQVPADAAVGRSVHRWPITIEQ